jgi:CubicO group peptidase (beta-lactamase class C family)
MEVDHDRAASTFADAATMVEAAVHGSPEIRVPGAVFGVALATGLRRVLTAGVADSATGRPVTADTPFCMASTTKPITATLLGDLLDRGLIHLDDPIGDHLGDAHLPRGLVDFREPTVGEVASHTAGFGTHARFFYDDEDEPVAVEDAIRTLARPMFEPGRDWRYSNLGYGVLQVALAHVGEQTFTDAVAERVFRPLGMFHSSIGGGEGPDGAATRHAASGAPYPPYVTDHPAASEAWCSIDDLLTFGLAHARADLLRPSTHALLGSPRAPRQPNEGAYALGWIHREFGPERISLLIHAGSMGGVSAHLAVVPELGLVVAGAANVGTGVVSDAVMGVLEALVPHYHRPADLTPEPFRPPDEGACGRWVGDMLVDDHTMLQVVLDVSVDRTITITLGTETVDVLAPRCGANHITGYALLVNRPRYTPPSAAWELALDVLDDTAHGSLTAHHHDPSGASRVGNSVSYAVRLVRS